MEIEQTSSNGQIRRSAHCGELDLPPPYSAKEVRFPMTIAELMLTRAETSCLEVVDLLRTERSGVVIALADYVLLMRKFGVGDNLAVETLTNKGGVVRPDLSVDLAAFRI